MATDDSPLSILKELIRIPSQNPMGQDWNNSTVDQSQWLEQRLSDWLGDFLQRHSIPHWYGSVALGRGNVIAVLQGSPDGRSPDGRSPDGQALDRPVVLLDAHQDTVPVSGMTIPPFESLFRDGRVYGRGACDVKGSMAAILSTLVRLQSSQQPFGTVIATFLCDEEHGQMGARRLASQWDDPRLRKPDFAIICEPTDLNVVVAHKGTIRWRIRTTGTAAHSSDPSQGENAIYAMAKVVAALQRLADKLAINGMSHSLCGQPTLSVGTIQGGQSVNMIPNECVVEVDRRIVPGEDPEAIVDETREAIASEVDVPFEMLPVDILSPPLVDCQNTACAEKLRSIAADVAGESQCIGVAYSTHAPHFASAGIATVVFGPGSITDAHTDQESIDVRQLDQAADVLFRFVSDV